MRPPYPASRESHVNGFLRGAAGSKFQRLAMATRRAGPPDGGQKTAFAAYVDVYVAGNHRGVEGEGVRQNQQWLNWSKLYLQDARLLLAGRSRGRFFIVYLFMPGVASCAPREAALGVRASTTHCLLQNTATISSPTPSTYHA